MMLSWLIVLYFINLMMFSLNSHCIYYCLLLVVNALVASFICYFVYGFSWYTLIFCLVYIGGVYVLFIFVSVFNPNDNFISYSGIGSFSVSFFFLLCVLSLLTFYSIPDVECSNLLCTVSEGWFYLCLCLTLVFSFLVLSLLSSWKFSFYR
uniref:NADH dehydrogenase subunit 6 n=1 Tax=Taenia caixuepengi TaxID=1548222 RepID=A0A8K1QY03_9CEST|nr:NADH dehydrogenase subunit 6 [Taenia caixuepengi]